MNKDYESGYAQAALVVDACFRIGYCTTEESRLMASLMLGDRLSGAEARKAFHPYLEKIRAGRKPAQGPGGGSNGTGAIVRPSSQAEQTEPDSAIWARWQAQMGAQGPEPVGEVLKAEMR